MPMSFKKPMYQTCKKCQHQSDIPQKGDCLFGIWEECPKCQSQEWSLEPKSILGDFVSGVMNFLK